MMSARATKVLIYGALVVLAPGVYWFMSAVAVAPIPYFVALAFAHPVSAALTAFPVIGYAILYWFLAQAVGSIVIAFGSERRRRGALALVIGALVLYASAPLYLPLQGSGDVVHLNAAEMIGHALGPLLPGGS